MRLKKLTTLAFAGAATLGALALSVESASARPGGGYRHGLHRHVGWHRHGWHHRHWRWRHHYGFYGAPLVVGATYAPYCYWVRRYGALIKVCE
jgi:hypothetical protein